MLDKVSVEAGAGRSVPRAVDLSVEPVHIGNVADAAAVHIGHDREALNRRRPDRPHYGGELCLCGFHRGRQLTNSGEDLVPAAVVRRLGDLRTSADLDQQRGVSCGNPLRAAQRAQNPGAAALCSSRTCSGSTAGGKSRLVAIFLVQTLHAALFLWVLATARPIAIGRWAVGGIVVALMFSLGQAENFSSGFKSPSSACSRARRPRSCSLRAR